VQSCQCAARIIECVIPTEMNEPIQSQRIRNGIERLALLQVRVKHRRSARAKERARSDALATVRNTLRGATKLRAGSTATVFNVGMYLLLLDQDIGYFTDDLVCAIGDRKRAFIAKYEAILLYEAAEDLPQLLGKKFREAVKALGASSEQITRLNSASSDLNRFWQRQQEFLGEIRNALAAHRDHDTLRYVEALEALGPLEVMKRAAELSQLLERLMGVITELAALTSQPGAIVQDMVNSAKRAMPDNRKRTKRTRKQK
jgi:hypothetical protein